jgi:hypothetical protein
MRRRTAARKTARLFLAGLLPLATAAAGRDAALDYYGVLDLGGRPPPQLLFEQPRLGRAGVAAGPPLFLHVPHDQARQWSRHCARYRACDRPAFFVSEEWYYGIYLGRARQAPPDPEETLAPGVPAR